MRVWVLLASGLFLSLPSAAYGEAYDPAPNVTAVQVLEHARDARGSLKPGTYTRVEQSHWGGIDTTSTTYTTGDDWLTTERSGGFTTSYGWYHDQPWDQDDNGIVILRSNFRSKVDPNVLAWQHPEDPKYHFQLLGLTQTLPQEYAIEANPPGGSDQFRYYDAKTYLLDRTVTFSKDRYRHVTDYSDYRQAFGEMSAFKVHSYDGRAPNDNLSETLSFDKTAAPPSLAVPQTRPLFTLSGTAPVLLPVRFTRGGIVLRVTVNGRGLDFLLDSGASGLFVDPGVAHELGLTPYGRASATIGGGDVDMGRVRIPQLQIGALQMQNVVFTTSPQDEQVEGSRIIGLMGFDLLASAITEVDFKAQTVTVYPRSQFDPAKLGLVSMPLQLDDGVPRVAASMEHVNGAFLIDTGAFSMLAYKNYVDKLPFAPIESNDYRIGTVGGAMNAQVRSVTDFAFAGILFRTATVVVPVESTFDISDYDAIIGRDALSAYQLYFDYADRMLYAKPNV